MPIKEFKPRNGMRYSRHPVPKLWKVAIVGVSSFISCLYAYDMHWENMMERFETDTGDIQLYPLTNVPDVWDEHIKRRIPMRKYHPLAQVTNAITADSERPIRGVEDVDGAPIWSPDVYDKVVYYKKSEEGFQFTQE